MKRKLHPLLLSLLLLSAPYSRAQHAVTCPETLSEASASENQSTRSGLCPEAFRATIDGVENQFYVLSNEAGMEACITNYGARLVSLMVPDAQGKAVDVVCGFPTIEGYTSQSQNHGAIVGRYIGRILGGKFTLDGTTYTLQSNHAQGHCAHGGKPNFGARMWTLVEQTPYSVTLRYLSPDGENGFPGNLDLRVTYSLAIDHALDIRYEATTDRPTVLNPCNHAFFNISGRLNESMENQVMWIDADSITPYDTNKCVTGELMNISSTPFDFRQPRRVGEHIDDDNDQLRVTGGYDHCWVLRSGCKDYSALADALLQGAPDATIYDPATRRCMEVYTTEPGIHVYTGNGLKGNQVGKQGIAYPRRSAVCFEACHFQNSPNVPRFPSTALRPGEVFRSRTIYRFTGKQETDIRECKDKK